MSLTIPYPMALFALAAAIIAVHGSPVEVSDANSPQDLDSTALFQTYVHVTDRSKEVDVVAATASMHILEKMWQWVTQASMENVTEPAERSHKDFIAAALLMTSVLPWSRQGATDGVGSATTTPLSHVLPVGQTLRYVSVLLLGLKHYCFQGQIAFLEIFLVALGLVFDFADQHGDGDDDMWNRLRDCVPQCFARLYPLYALSVIVCYLVFFSSPGATIETLFGGNLMTFYACGLAAWAFSIAFACYLVAALFTSSPADVQSSSAAMLYAGCVAMIILPRTLAAPVHGSWAWSEDKAVLELLCARRSLLLALALYFLGLVIARARLLAMEADADRRDAQVETAEKRTQDEDLWKAFEDEARREMIRAFSINKTADHSETGSLSPRSNKSD